MLDSFAGPGVELLYGEIYEMTDDDAMRFISKGAAEIADEEQVELVDTIKKAKARLKQLEEAKKKKDASKGSSKKQAKAKKEEETPAEEPKEEPTEETKEEKTEEPVAEEQEKSNEETPAEEPKEEAPATKAATKCKGKTAAGNPCKRNALKGGYCASHKDK